jgi:hypothetical protein
MNSNVQMAGTTQPKLLPSLISGFNAIANHIALILFPILIDVFLWFGPHLGIKNLLQPVINQVLELPEFTSSEMSEFSAAIKTVWTTMADRLNLVSGLRTYPVGIPSLLSNQLPIQTPLGSAPIYQISSSLSAIGISLIIFLIGLILGTWYFYAIARAIFPMQSKNSIQLLGWNMAQVGLLTLLILVLLILLSIPALILIPLVAIISPSIAEIVLFLVVGFILWLLIPLLFSPHGIFVLRQNAFVSILSSAKVVRLGMPSSIFFILIALLISQGMNYLWLVPPEKSWMTLVGIAGHAFITTGLLAASFVYYHDMMGWLKQVVQNNLSTSKEINI